MLIYLYTLNWLFSLIFMILNHPLSLGCILLLQTIIISLLSGFLYYNFWFSYILFLIMIGGMLVMFIYMTSIASNEKFSLPKTSFILSMILFFLLFLIMIICLDNFYSNIIISKLNFVSQNIYDTKLSLSKFFNYPNMQMMILLILYLLITLIAVVKIVGKNFGTLRQK